MDRRQLLRRLERQWHDLNQSYAGLSEAAMTEGGAVGDWSLKDVLAHVTTWEEETLKALPLLMESKRPPRYGGVNRFNAEQTARSRGLTLAQVLRQFAETHQRLLAFLQTVPESHFTVETRFRHRLRLDTYGHYPEHSASILVWRKARQS